MRRPNLLNKRCELCGEEYSPQCNNTKYCSKLCTGRADYKRNMLNPRWRVNKLVAMAKNRAATKLVDFDINTEYMMSLWTGTCAVTGVVLELNNVGYRRISHAAPSIDRIVPELGYTKGNVRIVSYQANVAISEYGIEQFYQFVEQAYKFSKGGVQ